MKTARHVNRIATLVSKAGVDAPCVVQTMPCNNINNTHENTNSINVKNRNVQRSPQHISVQIPRRTKQIKQAICRNYAS